MFNQKTALVSVMSMAAAVLTSCESSSTEQLAASARLPRAESAISDAIADVPGSPAQLLDQAVAAGQPDCNSNGVDDALELAGGTAADCNTNGVPDECDVDADTNGVPDNCEIGELPAPDCNSNGVDDALELVGGTAADCNTNGVPDECDLDADTNGVPDDCEIGELPAPDCNSNGVDDALDLAGGTSADCNTNSLPDECDITAATSGDCNTNSLPDECEPDLDGNGIPDDCDVASGTSPDCDSNGVGDGLQPDVDSDGLIDACDLCPDSDLAETIVLNGCDSGVANLLPGDDGCTMADELAECEDGARNHGAYVSCVAHLTNAWKRDGVITGQEKGRLQSCAAHKSGR